MGWTVLYIAFGVVALWLLGEVLLQYKARLRWRMLAFVGFVGVVLGVVLPSVLVIAVGTAAFAVGQTFVTLSFRRGFSMGWALNGLPGTNRRRPPEPEEPGPAEPGYAAPTLEVSGLREAYHPEPLPDDTEGYGLYTGQKPGPDGAQQPAAEEYGGVGADGFGGYPGYDGSGYDGAGYQGGYAGVGYGTDQQAPQPGAYADAYEYPDWSGYSAATGASSSSPDESYRSRYTDPYTGEYRDQYPGDHGSGYRDAHQPGEGYVDSYGAFGGSFGPGGTDQYEQHQYADGYSTDFGNDPYGTQQPFYQATPPGGVWVPQQRETGLPTDAFSSGQQGYPYQDGPSGGYPHEGYYPQNSGYPENSGYPQNYGYPENSGYPENPEYYDYYDGQQRY